MCEATTVSLAEAIRSAVRVGKLGEISAHLTQKGGRVCLTPGEAREAAERMREWLTDHDEAVRRAERSRIEAEPRVVSVEAFDVARGVYRANNGRGRSAALRAALQALGIEVEA
ncbi:hypothetical protein [Pseudoclavibacter helvolus]|uniref:Uncharacterized protein n=1 Tax=Pseudoclavibacter helvolus TaxID=255205 RepID=A0A7W4UM51_9MICO|nr:hypothetical protein [Pseudoclavibacter helvolus]MBB2956985.1 hypothetical protein [Pseudoclavibacter helvolus]